MKYDANDTREYFYIFRKNLFPFFLFLQDESKKERER